MLAVTVSKLRNNIKYYFDKVSESHDMLVVPRNENDEAIVIMSMSEYNSLQETAYLNSTSANRKHLEESMTQLETGKTITFNSLDELKNKVAK